MVLVYFFRSTISVLMLPATWSFVHLLTLVLPFAVGNG